LTKKKPAASQNWHDLRTAAGMACRMTANHACLPVNGR